MSLVEDINLTECSINKDYETGRHESLSHFLFDIVTERPDTCHFIMKDLVEGIKEIKKKPEHKRDQAKLKRYQELFNYIAKISLEIGTFRMTWYDHVSYQRHFYDSTLRIIWDKLLSGDLNSDYRNPHCLQAVLSMLSTGENVPEIKEEMFHSITDEMLEGVYAKKPFTRAVSKMAKEQHYLGQTLIKTFTEVVINILEGSVCTPAHIKKLVPDKDRVEEYMQSFVNWVQAYTFEHSATHYATNYAIDSIRDIFEAILLSPYATKREWVGIHSFVTQVEAPEFIRILSKLASSPIATPEGLRSMWRYRRLQAAILRNPNTPREFILRIINDIATGNRYQKKVYTFCKAIANNPSIKSTDLVPLLLLNRNNIPRQIVIPRQIIEDRIKELQEKEALEGGGHSNDSCEAAV